MFRKNDRVTYKGTDDTGTVISKRGDIVRVKWDDTGAETPVHPLELTHEKDGSISDQESATAFEINTHEKEDLMLKSIDFNGHVPTPTATPPANFKLEFFCTCGCGCDPRDPEFPIEPDCEVEGHHYAGPSAHFTFESNVVLSSYWDEKDNEIRYSISNVHYTEDGNHYQKSLNSREMEGLPHLYKHVKNRINGDTVEQYLEKHPHLLDKAKTVTDYLVIAREHDLDAGSLFEAASKRGGWTNA